MVVERGTYLLSGIQAASIQIHFLLKVKTCHSVFMFLPHGYPSISSNLLKTVSRVESLENAKFWK